VNTSKQMKMHDARFLAQQIVFGPMTFQAVRCMLAFGLLQAVDEASPGGAALDTLISKCARSRYAISTLLEVGVCAGIFELRDGRYHATKVGQCFLYDSMTRVNADFVHDVCYQGMFYLRESFENGLPEGLRVFGDWPTVYAGLSSLPPEVQQSWFAFDHFYSDHAFNDVIKIIMSKNPGRVVDIGCNTGKFETAFIGAGFRGEMILADLPQQLRIAEDNMKQNGYERHCVFYPVDVLDDSSVLPAAPDAVLMSQFLDCFSEEQIVSILRKAAAVMTDNSRLYILEPFWDNHAFAIARHTLTHTSLYFTAIANGKSKMYSVDEMKACADRAGLMVENIYENIGSHEHTLLECVKKI